MMIWSGEFNYHLIKCEEREADCGCRYKDKKVNNTLSDEKEQLKKIMSICETFNLIQVNHKPIINNYMIDLFTNYLTLHRRRR